MPTLARLCATLVFLGVGAWLCAGQSADTEATGRFLRQQRLIEERLEGERKEAAPIDSILDWQWGGWIEYYAFHYDDGIQESRFIQRPGMSVWTHLRLDDGAHQVFARMEMRYTHFREGDEIERQADFEGPDFDLLWYQIDVGKAFRLTDSDSPVQLRARVGRQNVLFGTGYALDMPMDAVWLDGKLGDLRAIGLFGKSIPSYPNIDRSEPVDSHSNRVFYGVQLAYEGFERHLPFVYALWNNDRTDERPYNPFQNYRYDSFYAGVGSRGEIVHNLNYWIEGVFESGNSYGDGAIVRRDYIEAYGWDIGIEKRFDVPTRPRIVGEYMFASGDSHRLFSPTNADGGNRGDDKDSSFVGFGFRDTGISLAPVTSNLHIWTIGGSFAPLEHIELCRDLEVGTAWFAYHKHKRRGAISDPLADEFSGWVGWEMDYFVNWRLASDLAWTVRWGTFFPGSAYSDRDARHFVFSGLTWSF